jgi:hypothetical protein
MQQQTVKLETLKQTVEKLQTRLYDRKHNETFASMVPEEDRQEDPPMSRFEEVRM